MPENAYLALLLDGPLQAWGFASRFQRRTTGLHPTKSGVIGLICAAMGLAKGSDEERERLPELAKLNMTTIAIPRNQVHRLDDFHTSGGGYDKKTESQFIPRKASGRPCDNPTVSQRQYLQDTRFGVILEGPRALAERAGAKLRDPQWGVWLGRKSCIPALPVLLGLYESEDAAWRAVLRACHLSENTPHEALTTVTDVKNFAAGTDSITDQPVSFGDGASSGPDRRQFSVRRIALKPGVPQS
jgi:CRISPR system Cascade subunit CasD